MFDRFTRYRALANFVFFQIGWLATVLGGAHDHVWAGCLIALLIVARHVVTVSRPMREFLLILCVVITGALWDSLLTSRGIIEYPHGILIPGLAPIWILAVWALFATTLNLSLRYLKGRWWLASLFGVIGAPLSFSAGMKLQALQFPDQRQSMWTLALGWAVLMPLLMRLAQTFNGVDEVKS